LEIDSKRNLKFSRASLVSDGEKKMQREQGYYWVDWGALADPDTVRRLPGPRLGWWNGEAWWFVLIDRYYFDSELVVLSERLIAPVLAPVRAAVRA
jgi:hypothetical protein